MIFKLQPKPTFKGVVDIPVPGSDPAKLTLIFKHKPRKELQAFYDNLFSEEAPAKTDSTTLCELVSGWEDVRDADNKAVEFSAEAFEVLLDNYPGAALAILTTYQDAYHKAKEKN